MLTIRAPAKINLSLEVLGKRTDGYHDLVSVMQTVTLWDTLHFKLDAEVIMTCSHAGLEGDANLVMKAIQLVRKHYHASAGCSVHLEKRIPTGAGLGGGSSDAAATLVGLAHVWKLSADCTSFGELATQLGSDVPFFLYGATALVEGRGERVTGLPRRIGAWYLLVKPSLTVPTSSVYASLPPAGWTDGATTLALARHLRSTGEARFGINGLQETVFRLFPEVRKCYEVVRSLAPDRTILSGSGPTIVAGFPSQKEAVGARRALAGTGLWTHLAADFQPPDWQTPCA